MANLQSRPVSYLYHPLSFLYIPSLSSHINDVIVASSPLFLPSSQVQNPPPPPNATQSRDRTHLDLPALLATPRSFVCPRIYPPPRLTSATRLLSPFAPVKANYPEQILAIYKAFYVSCYFARARRACAGRVFVLHVSTVLHRSRSSHDSTDNIILHYGRRPVTPTCRRIHTRALAVSRPSTRRCSTPQRASH